MPVTETAPVPVLPFDGFLTLLRARGFAVGLHEHLALAGLLHRWPGTSSPEFGDAIAALVGRNEDEVASIRRLFDEHYTPPPAVARLPELRSEGRFALRSRAWVLMALLATGVLAVGVLWWLNARPVIVLTNPPPDPVGTNPPVQITDVAPIDLPVPPVPQLPDPPRRLDRGVVTPVGVGLFLLALAGAWALKVRDERRRWLRRAWTTAADVLPGPFHFPFVLRDPVARLPRIDIEDAATILGRALTSEAQARELDVRRSVQLTVRNGMLPSFVFRSRRLMPTILVVQDVAEDMRVWRDKVDLFLRDLQRQGVPLERYYFHADPRRVSDAPRGGMVHDLDRVLRRRPMAPLLIVSNGGGLAPLSAALSRPGRAGRAGGPGGAGRPGIDDEWVRTLRGRDRKTWLTPVSDARLWPTEFDLLPLRVWPMTRRGLAQAARDLAGVDVRPPERVLARILDEGRVTLDGIERMQRLASLVPYPTTELLELLRRRFAPDVPDAVIVHLLQQSGRPAAPVLRMTDEEIREFAAAVRFETPKLEAQVRRVLLDILRESEPQPGSAAHLRWQIAVAAHQLALADLGEGSRADAAAVLESLGRGPLWEEARKVAGLMPSAPALNRTASGAVIPVPVVRAGGAADDGGVPIGDPPTNEPMPWTWPGLRELVPASALTLLLVSLGWLGGAFPVRVVAHVEDAYRLSETPGRPPNAPELVIDVGPAGTRANGPAVLASTAPTRVDLYQDDTLYRSGLDISAGPATVRLAETDLGHHYRARATLSAGNLAVSDPVWVRDQATAVVIDAMPWARVTIAGGPAGRLPAGAGQLFTTPFTIRLTPGTYRLQFENGNLTAPMEQTITVDATSRTYRFTMPGFDPAAVVNQLTPAQAGPTAR